MPWTLGRYSTRNELLLHRFLVIFSIRSGHLWFFHLTFQCFNCVEVMCHFPKTEYKTRTFLLLSTGSLDHETIGLQCVSQNMNRSQHAFTDYNDSNLAVSLRSHSNCFKGRQCRSRPWGISTFTIVCTFRTAPECSHIIFVSYWTKLESPRSSCSCIQD